MAKDDNMLQMLFKVSNKNSKGESLIFNVLSKCENRTELIKNALFHYIVNIQNGNIIDKIYPYNEVDKYTDLEKVMYALDFANQNNTSNTNIKNSNQYDNDNNNGNNDDEYEYDEYEYDEYEYEYENENEYEDENENEYEDENVDLAF